MPQLIAPGNPAAIGIEASVISALVQTFGFAAQGQAFAANLTTAPVLIAGVLTFGWVSVVGNPDANKPVPCKDKKSIWKTCVGPANANAPLLVAATTAAAFAAGNIISSKGVMVGDLIAVFGITFVWNAYISSMAFITQDIDPLVGKLSSDLSTGETDVRNWVATL